jgi:hypothetical protein
MSVLPDMSFCADEICGLEMISRFRTEASGPHIVSEIVSAAPIPDDEHLQVILYGRRVPCVSGLQR